MTKKNMYESLINVVIASTAENKDELLVGLQHELDLLAKKAASPKKPSARQLENAELAQEVIYRLSDTPQTVSDLISILAPAHPDITNQRLTHILTALVTDGKARREVIKRKAYYSAADDADAE